VADSRAALRSGGVHSARQAGVQAEGRDLAVVLLLLLLMGWGNLVHCV
jgi:hypothetical protein